MGSFGYEGVNVYRVNLCIALDSGNNVEHPGGISARKEVQQKAKRGKGG